VASLRQLHDTAFDMAFETYVVDQMKKKEQNNGGKVHF
jgi:hypothetical protein